jgi:hypothetical protein
MTVYFQKPAGSPMQNYLLQKPAYEALKSIICCSIPEYFYHRGQYMPDNESPGGYQAPCLNRARQRRMEGKFFVIGSPIRHSAGWGKNSLFILFQKNQSNYEVHPPQGLSEARRVWKDFQNFGR